jgi:hypothetical protein
MLPTTKAIPGKINIPKPSSYHCILFPNKKGSVMAEKKEVVAMVATATEAFDIFIAP